MTAQLVPTIRTSYQPNDIIKGFIEGWRKQFGKLPQKKSIAVLWAHNQHETGGTLSMWNNNIGNSKYVPSNSGIVDNTIQYMMLSNVWEMMNGKKVFFQPPDPQTWFRSFPTLADGIAFHLNFLQNKRYKKAWVAIEDGDPNEFAHLLKAAGYYTAPETDYAKSLSLYFNKFMKETSFEKAVESLQEVVVPELVPLPEIAPAEVLVETANAPEVNPVQKSVWQTVTNLFSNFTKKS